MTCGPLSHSSASTLLSCEQKYAFYKILKIDPDSDYTKSDALAIGSAFHYVIEKCKHTWVPDLRKRAAACVDNPDIQLDEKYISLIHAMCVKYLRLHKAMGWKVIGIEQRLETETFLGYVDAVMEDPEGSWWIVDLKALGRFDVRNAGALRHDPQMSLYAGHRALLAESLGLDLKKFAGTCWKVVVKPKLKQKKKESDKDYTVRLIDNTETYHVPVPFNEPAVEERLEIHAKLHARSARLFDGEPPLKNYGNCMAYFSPCEYWSQCHKVNHSEMEGLDIVEHEE